jgi:hypothetical protein
MYFHSLFFTFALALFNFTSVLADRVLLVLYALKLGAQPFAVGILAATYSVLPTLGTFQSVRIKTNLGALLNLSSAFMKM